jgi:LPS export ABC transporter protein LptC
VVRQTKVFLALKPGRPIVRTLCPLIIPLLLLLSCSKAPKPNESLKVHVEDPVMSAGNIEILFSDSGTVLSRLTAPLMNRFAGDDPYLELPRGFRIAIYDSSRQVTSTITGNRGLRRETAHTMEAWGNVVVRNELKNEQLNTEHLIWDVNRHRIWSDVHVKITRPDQVLYGSGMESNESFTRYSIQDPSGEMNVKSDSL